jgi:RNA polymerase sigma factor (sigma-70 family)
MLSREWFEPLVRFVTIWVRPGNVGRIPRMRHTPRSVRSNPKPVGSSQSVDLAKMYEDHLSRVYGFFAFRLRPGPDAEDLTATTFERAMRHAHRYDAARATQATWLMAIAQNALVDHFRHHGRRPEDLIDASGFDELPAGASGDGPRLGVSPELETALSALGDREREVVALRFGGELRGKEIAAVTGLSEANVHQILSRSMKELRRLMPAR